MGGIKRESEHAKVDASPTIRQTSEKTRVLNNLEPLEKLRFLAFFFFLILLFPVFVHTGKRLPHRVPTARLKNLLGTSWLRGKKLLPNRKVASQNPVAVKYPLFLAFVCSLLVC